MILLCDVIYLIDIVSPNNEMYNKTSKVLSVCQTNTFQRHWEVSIWHIQCDIYMFASVESG